MLNLLLNYMEIKCLVNEEQQWFRYDGSVSKKNKINSPKIDEENEEAILLFYELIK